MKTKLETCPKCGSKINEVISNSDKNLFYKCSNENCHFTLPTDFTEEDIILQGYILNAKCKKCGEHLEVACGTKDLYPRCYHCNPKISENTDKLTLWSNACHSEALKEIEQLITVINNESYFFSDDYEVINSYHENNNSKQIDLKNEEVTLDIKESDLAKKILTIFSKDLNKPYTSLSLAEILEKSSVNVRACLNYLKSMNKIKAVGYQEIGSKPLIIEYQLVESSLEELKTVSKKDGFDSISNFLKSHNIKIEGSKFLKLIKENNLEMKPILFERGLIKGYRIKEMLNLSISKNKAPKRVKINPPQKSDIEKKVILKSDESKKPMEAKILDYLEKNNERGISSNELENSLKVYHPSLQNCLRSLRIANKIKFVGIIENSENAETLIPLYQIKNNPMEALSFLNNPEDFSTITNFRKTHKGVRITPNLIEALKEHKTFILVKGKLYIGYSNEILNKFLLENKRNDNGEETTEKNNLLQNDSIITSLEEEPTKEIESNSLFHGSLFNFFRKKEKLNTETISF